MFELELEQPIDDTLRWAQLAVGCILKVPVPTRESPLYESAGAESGVVTRNIWEISGGNRGLYKKARADSRQLATLKSGARVNEIGRTEVDGALWLNVITQTGGVLGWMNAKKRMVQVGTVTENLWNGQIVAPKGIAREQCREQLFRIYSVERDARERSVTVKAMHISYDLSGNLVGADYAVEEKTAAREVLTGVFDRLAAGHEFDLHIAGGALDAKITGDYGWKNPIECMLDPDEGILAQTGALLLRDNFDLYVLADTIRDSGVTVRRGKNLVGVTVTEDASSVVTRIIPCGRKMDGSNLFLQGESFIDSPHIGDYPAPHVKRVDYDVKVVEEDADGETTFPDNAAAREKLRALAEADFSENGVDLPTYGMDVDFVLLQNAAEYANYAGLQSVYLNDTVTVIDELIGLTAKLRVTGYEWNALTRQYERVTLGELSSLKQTVYSYNLPSGGISGTKLAAGSVPGMALRDATIGYAKIAVAAINQLTADSIVALTAKIQEIVANKLTTDELYAALAQLNTAVIENAEIQWADIQSLQAAVAALAKASIGTADIGWAQIKDLITGAAIITEGEAGKLMISRLAVTEANMVSLTTGELVVRGEDGHFYAVTVDAEGNVRTELKQVSNGDVHDLSINAGEKLIEGSVTAACLNATDIFADNAVIRQMIAANLDVDTLFAREAFVDLLRTSHIVGEKTLEIVVRDAESASRDAADARDAVDNLQFGGRNLLLGSASMVVDRLGSAPGSSAEFSHINVGQSYMDVPAGTEVTISFDLTMTVNTANPWLNVYSLNYPGPKGIETRTLNFTAQPGETIQRRCHVTTSIFDRDDATLPDNYLEFYSEYGTSNWYRITNLKLERGNRATDWTPAPEDVDEKINGMEFGGRNLLLGSAEQIENANYLLHEYKLSSNAPDEGEICTIQIKGELGSDRVYFGIFNSDGGHPVVERLNTQNERGIYVATFKWTKKSPITEVEANNSTLRIYQYNSAGTSSSRIEWIKLERGNQATDWIPAPEDVDAAIDGIEFGGRNLLLGSASYVIDKITSQPSVQPEYFSLNVGQSYMDVPDGTEVTISFDLELAVNTANPQLQVYNTNVRGPKQIGAYIFYFTANVGATIRQRCAFTTVIRDCADATLPDNYIEFYTIYGTSNWYRITNLKLERGNRATDWTPAPEDVDGRIGDVSARVDGCVTHAEQDVYMRAVAGRGVYVGFENSPAQAFIDAAGWFRVLHNGVSITSLGPRIQELGTLTIYETADGGHAFI